MNSNLLFIFHIYNLIKKIELQIYQSNNNFLEYNIKTYV